MLTNQQSYKRITKQVRVGVEVHKILKLKSVESGMTISKLLDEICMWHFEFAERGEKSLGPEENSF